MCGLAGTYYTFISIPGAMTHSQWYSAMTYGWSRVATRSKMLTANDETRKNVNSLIKEAISSTIKLDDDKLVIELLEFLQTDKKIKTLTDTT